MRTGLGFAGYDLTPLVIMGVALTLPRLGWARYNALRVQLMASSLHPQWESTVESVVSYLAVSVQICHIGLS